MLNFYLQQTQRLLNDEANELYNVADLTVYINIGRNQIASASETLLYLITGSLSSGANTLSIAGLTLPTGAGGVMSARSVSIVNSDTTQTLLEGRPWQWFKNYYLNGAASDATGNPKVWANFQQGSQGTLYFSPTPTATVNLLIEANCTAQYLTTDSTPEILSYPWTDAVPYFAAYMALLNAQRADDAAKMLQLYEKFMGAARTGVTPETLPKNFPMKGQSAQAGG